MYKQTRRFAAYIQSVQKLYKQKLANYSLSYLVIIPDRHGPLGPLVDLPKTYTFHQNPSSVHTAHDIKWSSNCCGCESNIHI